MARDLHSTFRSTRELQSVLRSCTVGSQGPSRLRRLARHFTHPLALLLWAAALLAFVGGMTPLEVAIVLNAEFGFFQKPQAERATEALRLSLMVRGADELRRCIGEMEGLGKPILADPDTLVNTDQTNRLSWSGGGRFLPIQSMCKDGSGQTLVAKPPRQG
jgi:hypothetical protein